MVTATQSHEHRIASRLGVRVAVAHLALLTAIFMTLLSTTSYALEGDGSWRPLDRALEFAMSLLSLPLFALLFVVKWHLPLPVELAILVLNSALWGIVARYAYLKVRARDARG